MSFNTIHQKALYHSTLFQGCDMVRYTSLYHSLRPITLVKRDCIGQLPYAVLPSAFC